MNPPAKQPSDHSPSRPRSSCHPSSNNNNNTIHPIHFTPRHRQNGQRRIRCELAPTPLPPPCLPLPRLGRGEHDDVMLDREPSLRGRTRLCCHVRCCAVPSSDGCSRQSLVVVSRHRHHHDRLLTRPFVIVSLQGYAVLPPTDSISQPAYCPPLTSLRHRAFDISSQPSR